MVLAVLQLALCWAHAGLGSSSTCSVSLRDREKGNLKQEYCLVKERMMLCHGSPVQSNNFIFSVSDDVVS